MSNAATKTASTEKILILDATEQELGKEVSAVEYQALNVVIMNDDDYRTAGDATSEVKKMQKKVEEYWEPMRVSAKKTYDDVLDHKKEMLTPLKNAEKILKSKMANYVMEQERKRKEQEEAMKKLAEAAVDKKIQEAIDAQSRGDEAAAEFAMAEAEVYDNAAVNGAIVKQSPKANGVSTSKAWKITAIDSSKVPINFNGMELRPVDEKLVMQLIKASKGKIVIPGVKYEETVAISIRS